MYLYFGKATYPLRSCAWQGTGMYLLGIPGHKTNRKHGRTHYAIRQRIKSGNLSPLPKKYAPPANASVEICVHAGTLLSFESVQYMYVGGHLVGEEVRL